MSGQRQDEDRDSVKTAEDDTEEQETRRRAEGGKEGKEGAGPSDPGDDDPAGGQQKEDAGL